MKPILLALGCGLLISGCASNTLKAPEDYPQLTLKADESNTLVFTKPHLRLGSVDVLPPCYRSHSSAAANDSISM